MADGEFITEVSAKTLALGVNDSPLSTSLPAFYADDIVLASFRNKQKQYQQMVQGLQVSAPSNHA